MKYGAIVKKMPRAWVLLQAVLILAWLTNLAHTDALFSVYALLATVGVFCVYDNHCRGVALPRNGWGGSLALSCLFSGAVLLANYPLFTQLGDPAVISLSTSKALNLFNAVGGFLGGTVLLFSVLTCLTHRLPLAGNPRTPEKPGRVFWGTFCLVAVIDCVYLFLDEYPGHITPDSLGQILQGMEGAYVNDHPFWHTLLIKGLLTLGYGMFGSANGAVAFFSFCQILLLAACMGYAVMTLYQLRSPVWFLAGALFVYALIPYNIAYSITMWKDIPFGVGIALLSLALLRQLRSVGSGKRNLAVLALGALLLGLMRTSGLAALLGGTAILAVCLWKRWRAALPVLLGAAAIAWVLTGPVLTALQVQDTDVVESLSLPLQQMARVAAEEGTLTEEEEAELSRIFDLEHMDEIYTPWLSDPVKNHVREWGADAIRNHTDTYLTFWVRLGLRYPGAYLRAWVEQTKGYWNGGYDYRQYAEMLQENSLGLAKTRGGNPVAKLMDLYFSIARHAVYFQPLQSIGLHVWALVLCLFLGLRSRQTDWVCCVFPLVVVLGLMFGTPVYAEFRYVYSVFLVCPPALAAALFRREREM